MGIIHVPGYKAVQRNYGTLKFRNIGITKKSC